MITVSEIKQKAERKYISFLKDKISSCLNCKIDNVFFFPLYIKADKGKPNEDLKKYEQEIVSLLEKSKNKTGSGYKLEFEDIKTMKFGHQQKLKNIIFETEEDYILFLKKNREVKNLFYALEILKAKIFLSKQELNNWALTHTADLISDFSKEENFWENICLCVNWLHENPKSDLYIREIPLPVHTKFIESNKALIHSFFSQNTVVDFESKHGLKLKPYLVRFRTLDEYSLNFEKLSVSELSLPLQDFIHLDKSGCLQRTQTIFIVENEMVYLTFPKIMNTLCVWGHGFTVTMLKSCEWLNKYRIRYFGDLDEHGFQILSDFRITFPQTQSFCMDVKTLDVFSNFLCKGKSLSGNIVPPNLTDDEKATFHKLRNRPEKNRLEQERITIDYICRELDECGM